MNELGVMLGTISFTRILAASVLILCALVGTYLWILPMLGINNGTYIPLLVGLLFLFSYSGWVSYSGFKGSALIVIALSITVGAATAGATLLVLLGFVLNMRGS